jgi:hypothetical protein
VWCGGRVYSERSVAARLTANERQSLHLVGANVKKKDALRILEPDNEPNVTLWEGCESVDRYSGRSITHRSAFISVSS